jgi:putative transposase
MISADFEGLSIRHQCRLLGVNRSGYYYRSCGEISIDQLEVQNEIDEIFTQNPCYGSRRIVAALKRRGFEVGRTRVHRLMKEMAIEAISPRKRLSIRDKAHKIYPYLLRTVKVDRINKVWSSDITYIRLKQGYVYLVAIIDHYSRFILFWSLSTTLDRHFCIQALEDAISKYGLPEYFNSDHGTQFTSAGFISVLKSHKINISMNGVGGAHDNIFVERFWRTLKYEEVYIKSYQNLVDCRKNLKDYFEYYNRQRLHQGISYMTPVEVFYGEKKQHNGISCVLLVYLNTKLEMVLTCKTFILLSLDYRSKKRMKL